MNDPTVEQVILHEERHRFELPIEGDVYAFTEYETDEEGRYVLTHTKVPDEYSGHGLASTLARGIFEIARARGYRLVLKCPFLTAWYARHREYGDVVDG
jgi:predicted GNAT family acetyltransferase